MDDKGQITLVSSYAAEKGIASMQFSVNVKAASADRVEFLFDESNGKIREFRYDKDSGKLTVYIAGTGPLVKDGDKPLTIGSIQVLNGNGSAEAATVSVESLMYVDGGELKWMKDLEPQGSVQIGSSGSRPEPTPTPSPAPQPGDSPSDEPDPTPVPTAAPTPQPTRVPQTAQTPWPVRPSQSAGTASPSPSPAPTATPEPSAGSQQPEESKIMTPGASDSGAEGKTQDSEKLDWTFVIAIGAMILFVIVAVMAVVVLKKKPRFDGFDDDF